MRLISRISILLNSLDEEIRGYIREDVTELVNQWREEGRIFFIDDVVTYIVRHWHWSRGTAMNVYATLIAKELSVG